LQDENMEASDSEDEGQRVIAAELAGLKVKHTADELMEGETIVLTLADRGILDDKGELVDDADELEEVARVCFYNVSAL
jgi:U4/U6.U5 tri-snRNP-associated protein 1